MLSAQSAAQPSHANFPAHISKVARAPVSSVKYEGIAAGLPLVSYNPMKEVFVPLNPELSNEGRFESVEDALKFLCSHCMRAHGSFTLKLAKRYAHHCLVYDVCLGGFVLLSSVNKRRFIESFGRVSGH